MGQVPFLLDEMGLDEMGLDEMGLDEMALNRSECLLSMKLTHT